MSRETRRTSTRRPSLEQVLDLAGFIASMLAKLSFEQVSNLLSKKKTILRLKLMEVFKVAMMPDLFAEVRAEWEKFYNDRKDHFKVVADFSEVVIPPKPTNGSWCLIFIAKGLTMNATLAAMRANFKAWAYQKDLDGNVPTNTRTSIQSYAKWVRDGIEPDEEYLGKSTRDADMFGTIGTTLLERLVQGLKYFIETGKHLDEKGWTICTGSRDVGGDVPIVDFDPDTGKVRVDWDSVGSSNPQHGLRQAA